MEHLECVARLRSAPTMRAQRALRASTVRGRKLVMLKGLPTTSDVTSMEIATLLRLLQGPCYVEDAAVVAFSFNVKKPLVSSRSDCSGLARVSPARVQTSLVQQREHGAANGDGLSFGERPRNRQQLLRGCRQLNDFIL